MLLLQITFIVTAVDNYSLTFGTTITFHMMWGLRIFYEFYVILFSVIHSKA